MNLAPVSTDLLRNMPAHRGAQAAQKQRVPAPRKRRRGSWDWEFLSATGNAYRSASVERIVEQPSTEASSSFSPALKRQNVSPLESVSCLIALVYPP